MAVISSARMRLFNCSSAAVADSALSRNINSHQRAGSSMAARRAARSSSVHCFFRRNRMLLTPRMRPPPMVVRPARRAGQVGADAQSGRRAPARSGSASRSWTICFWPAVISVFSSIATRAEHRRGADVQMRFEKSSSLPFTESRMRNSASAIVTGAGALDALRTMPRRTIQWSISGRFSATHSPARASRRVFAINLHPAHMAGPARWQQRQRVARCAPAARGDAGDDGAGAANR